MILNTKCYHFLVQTGNHFTFSLLTSYFLSYYVNVFLDNILVKMCLLFDFDSKPSLGFCVCFQQKRQIGVWEISWWWNKTLKTQNEQKLFRGFILPKYTLECIHDFYIFILKQNFSKKRHNHLIAFLVIFAKKKKECATQ